MRSPHTGQGIGSPVPANFWVGYPIAEDILACLTEMILKVNPHRPEGALLLSSPFNGKTFTMKRLRKLIAESQGILLEEDFYAPCPFIQAPRRASTSGLYVALAQEMRIPTPRRAFGEMFHYFILRAGADLKTKAIFVDELQHLSDATISKRNAVLNDLKALSNDLQIPIIAAGTHRAFEVVRQDVQFLSRLRPIELPEWKNDRVYRGLLQALETRMGVETGTFSSAQCSEILWRRSKGLIGQTVRLLNQSLDLAVQEGANHVGERHIEAAGFAHIPTYMPGARPYV